METVKWVPGRAGRFSCPVELEKVIFPPYFFTIP
jgi:hypothetical protein